MTNVWDNFSDESKIPILFQDLKFLTDVYLEPLLQCSFLIDIEVRTFVLLKNSHTQMLEYLHTQPHL